MNREDIICMALDAGCKPFEFGATIAHVEDLERFATLVAQQEREACAKLCEDEDVASTDDAIGVQLCIAESIRARAREKV